MAGSKNNKKRNLSKHSPDPESIATGGPSDYSALELSPPWFTTPVQVQTILDPVSNSPYRTPHTPGRAPTYTDLTSRDQQICSGMGTLSQSQAEKRRTPKIQKEYGDDGLAGYTVSSLKAVRHHYNYSLCIYIYMVWSIFFPPAARA